MKSGDISNVGADWVLFQFHELVQHEEPPFEFMGKLFPKRYWKADPYARSTMSRMANKFMVMVLVYDKGQAKAAEAFLHDQLYQFNRVVVTPTRQDVDQLLDNPMILSMLTREGCDGFGRALVKSERWGSL